jgi:hypothetical protein
MDKRELHTSQDYIDNFVLSAAKLNHHQNLLDDVVTINSLQAAYPHLFTKPQLSWILKMRHKNGLDQLGAILKISRKLYIKKSIFIDWFLEQRASDS